jgi:hypothetical protein
VTAEEADDWGITVNECGIFACRNGMDVWMQLWERTPPERVTTFAMTPCGGEHHVLAPSKDDAEFMRDYMISKGVNKPNVKVQRLSVAKANAAKRTAAFNERTERIRAEMASDTPEPPI